MDAAGARVPPLLIVTRPAAQAPGWVRALEALGQPAQALPLIGIAPVTDAGPVRDAWAALPGCALAMFVSANAVEGFFAAGRLAGADAAETSGTPRWPAGVLAGSTGPGTSAALRAAGVPADALVEPGTGAAAFDSEALWERLAGRPWQGRRVLIVRGEGGGRDWMAQTLREHGATVDFVVAYRRVPPALDDEERALLRRAQADPRSHAWLFGASEAVANLQALAPGADWSAAHAVASHPRIAAAARAAGFGRVDEVALATPAAVAAALAGSQPAQGPPIQSAAQ